MKQQQRHNPSRWKSGIAVSTRCQIITLLEDASEDDLKAILKVIKKKVVMNQDITNKNDDEADSKNEEQNDPILAIDDDTPINIMEEIAKGLKNCFQQVVYI